jgi:hypothetical protein
MGHTNAHMHKYTNRMMRWKWRRQQRSATAAEIYTNQLIAAAEEMVEAATAMATVMAMVGGGGGGGGGNTMTAVTAMTTATRRQWQWQWRQWVAAAATLRWW